MARTAFLLIIILFVFTGCGKKGKIHHAGNGNAAGYTVRIKTFIDKESAERFSEDLKNQAPDNEIIQGITIAAADTSKKKAEYSVEIEDFPTSFSAGMSAFELYSKKIIKDYSLYCNGLSVYDEFANIFFVGKFRRRPAVYNYNLKTGKHKVFWSGAGETVMELNSSKDGKSVFFLTASDFGRKTIFPYVNNVKIYRLDMATMLVEKLKNLGNGVQLFTSWETPGSFKIVFNTFDIKKSTFVIQTTLLYTTNGKMLKNEKVVYDITKEKYPVPRFYNNDFAPINNNYEFAVTNINKQNVLSLTDSQKVKKTVFTTSQAFNSVDCWENGKSFVFSTFDISPNNKTLKSREPQTSELCIYSTPEGRVIKSWKGAGYKNFLLRGDLLFFDDGFDENSKIMIYDLKNKSIINTIAIQGGCGIKNIPIIPY